MVLRNHLNRRYIILAILISSVIVRIIASAYLGNQVVSLPGTADQISYHTLALRVLDGHGFSFGSDWWPATRAGEPTAHWSYIYTLYLTIVYAIFDKSPLIARLFQAIFVGIFQPLLTYWIARRLFNEIVGQIAMVLSAFYLYFIYYAAALMTEAFYITAVLAIFFLTIRIIDVSENVGRNHFSRKYIGLTVLLGICLGIAVTLRQVFLFIIPLIFLWLGFSNGVKRLRASFFTIVVSSAIIILSILPFTIYNYSRFHQFVLLNTNAGYAFYLGNHPIHGTHFISASEMEDYQSLFPPELRDLNEASLEKALLKRGINFVLDDPVRYILLSLSRIPDYFTFWPSQESIWISNVTRVGSFGLLLPFMLCGIILWLRDQYRRRLVNTIKSPGFLLLGFTIVYTGIHVLTWTSVRYRLPIDAVLIVYGAYGLSQAYNSLRTIITVWGVKSSHGYQRH